MGDFKSKIPDLKELGAMTSKLFKGIKNSVSEIVHDYNEKRAQTETKESKPTTKTEKKAEAKKNTDE